MASSSKQTWQLSDAGILRKKAEDEELLVFGYSCKLFHDDEKALYIDQGKHLIPWMGDETLKIDRYDGRGALYDLKQFEARPGGQDDSSWAGMSDAERHVEQLCNEERYRALHHSDENEAMYQEEELKRLHQALGAKSYGEVGFDYDRPNAPPRPDPSSGGAGEAAQADEDDQPFVAPPELDIPVNMVLPERTKLNAIIEKTALFISGQGAQMEILLKMKQAGNPHFDFLSFDSPLHPYYRYLQMAIKTGRYQPRPDKPPDNNDNGDEDSADEDYLHPSLVARNSRVELAPSIPSIAYKPSADCSYSILVNRIKDKQAAFSCTPPLPAPTPPAPAPAVIEAVPVLYGQAQVQVDVPAVPAGREAQGRVFTPVTHVAPPPVVVPTQPYATPSFLVPPQDVQVIVDKMASYVAKNGRDFEAIVRGKGDPRFEFLQAHHQYYPYYLHKVDMFERLERPEAEPAADQVAGQRDSASSESEADEDSRNGSGGSVGEESDRASHATRPALAPVCFSIKKPKDSDPVLDLKSALPVEESSDEERPKGGEEEAAEEAAVEAEVIDLTCEGEKKGLSKERWESERAKDKLASAARERLAVTSRDKQLQLERKRRAEAFLTMIHKTPADLPPPKPTPTHTGSCDEDDVSSLPSPLSSPSPSPSSVGPEGGEERLKANGGPTSLLARLQGGKEVGRTARNARTDSDSDKDRDRKKRKKKSSHKRHRTPSPPPRSHKQRGEDHHSRTKKAKRRDRSKSPVKPHRKRSHNHSERSEPGSRSRALKRSQKKSKRSRRSSASDSSS